MNFTGQVTFSTGFTWHRQHKKSPYNNWAIFCAPRKATLPPRGSAVIMNKRGSDGYQIYGAKYLKYRLHIALLQS